MYAPWDAEEPCAKSLLQPWREASFADQGHDRWLEPWLILSGSAKYGCVYCVASEKWNVEATTETSISWEVVFCNMRNFHLKMVSVIFWEKFPWSSGTHILIIF